MESANNIPTLATETATSGTGAITLVGPTNSSPNLKIRYLLAGQGIRLTTVDAGRGLRMSGSAVSNTSTAVRSVDVVATNGQFRIDTVFPQNASQWPLGPFTVPCLVYTASGSSISHQGGVNFLVGDIPPAPCAFDLEFSLTRSASQESAAPSTEVVWQVTLTLPTANASVAYNGLLTVPAGAFLGTKAVRCPVVWDESPAQLYKLVGPDGTIGMRPTLPADAAGSEVFHVCLLMTNSVLPLDVGILGMRFVWWMPVE